MEKVIQHFCHEHPLILTENVGNEEAHLCYGCHNPVNSEAAYVCSQQYCGSASTSILHKRCAELPRQILHPAHPQHPLHLFDYQRRYYSCTLCFRRLDSVLRYRCSGCHFNIDISCQQLGSIDELLQEKMLQHPSHHHPLTLMRKPPSIFCCDGCGTEDRDIAYICSICNLWIHKTCASLPLILPTNHHRHELSLAFYFPIEHRKFQYRCEICREECPTICWVYYCGDCKYFAHVKCATSKATKEIIPAESSDLNRGKNDGSNLIQLPVHDTSKELITPFVIREKGLDKIPDTKDMPASIIMPETTRSFSLLFNYHKHPLCLVLEGPADDESIMMKICDVCTTPIYSPPYYKCATCNKYFVHSTCYFLPKTLCLDSVLYGDCPATSRNHKLTAYTSSELDNTTLLFCHLCQLWGNGRFYKCEDCYLHIDVRCASLPTTIKHTSHPQHELIMKRRTPEEEVHRRCGCGSRLSSHYTLIVAYYCTNDGCNYALDWRCALLPQSVKDKRDKHPLLLTYDASIDHPTDFYCEICEDEMHPKKWMYYCRQCDHSFDTECLAASGYNRNIKFGREFEFDHRLHPHPLTFNQVTLKSRCDSCHRYWYSFGGFECESCNYVLCFFCGLRELGKM